MKKICYLLTLLLAGLGLLARAGDTGTNTPSKTPSSMALPADRSVEAIFHRGLVEEEANQDLPAAIQAYREAIVALDASRQMEATAIFRLGECYRKQGQTNDALIQYRRVLSDFSDQPAVANLSRAGLRALNATETASTIADAGPSGSPGVTEEEAKELQRVKILIQSSPDLINAYTAGDRTLLWQAAHKGYLAVARFLLANGASPNAQPGGQTLIAAASIGNKAMVELLLANGADVNAHSGDGQTALAWAAGQNFKSVVDVLLANKADPNVRADKKNALMAAADRGAIEIVQSLLAAGANVNATNQEQWTALTFAVDKGYPRIVELLLAKGADPSVRVKTSPLWARLPSGMERVRQDEVTPLHLAIHSAKQETVALLLEHGANPNAKAGYGHSPLHYAVGFNLPEIANLLLSKNVDLEVRADWGSYTSFLPNQPQFARVTPLELAIRLERPLLVKALLAKGAVVNTRTVEGDLPLHLATRAKDIEIMQAMLERKPDLEVTNAMGLTPLQVACDQDNVATAKLLADAGANVNAASFPTQSPAGQTPLFWAVKHQNKAMVELLLDHRADVNVVDLQGNTPLSYLPPPASSVSLDTGGSIATISLNVPGSPTSSPDADAIRELLLKAGANPNIARQSCISIRRPESRPVEQFRRGTVTNRFTLLELLAEFYRSPADGARAFPDFQKLTIERLSADGRSTNVIPVDVAAILQSADCAKDVWLEWGDIVQLPIADHPLRASWEGKVPELFACLDKCVTRKVLIKVKGQTVTRTLRPWFGPGMSVVPTEGVRDLFWLQAVIQNSGLLRTSSDTSRITVHRAIPGSGQTQTLRFNLKVFRQEDNLWLRDGDVIEIPDRE